MVKKKQQTKTKKNFIVTKQRLLTLKNADKIRKIPRNEAKTVIKLRSMLTVRIWREDEAEELLSRAPCCSRGIWKVLSISLTAHSDGSRIVHCTVKGVDCEAFLLCVDQNRWGACKNQKLMAISYKGDWFQRIRFMLFSPAVLFQTKHWSELIQT